MKLDSCRNHLTTAPETRQLDSLGGLGGLARQPADRLKTSLSVAILCLVAKKS